MLPKVLLTFFFTIVLLISVGCSVSSKQNISPGVANNSKYFLSWKQKGQLMSSGHITDESGTTYDVWIVPGYKKPIQKAGDSFLQAGGDFSEYFDSRKYKDLADDSGSSFRYAYEDCLNDIIIEGVPSAWGEYWSSANRRTERRVFGWWFAYPWALMQSTVDTIVRVPVGLIGTALWTVWGTVAIPSFYAVNSAVSGTWNGFVGGIVLPTTAVVWNTAIAPPMALLGQTPSPERVDGFWVSYLKQPSPSVSRTETPSMTELEALTQWAFLLRDVVQPYKKEQMELNKKMLKEIGILQQETAQATKDLNEQKKSAIKSLYRKPEVQEVVSPLQAHQYDRSKITELLGAIRSYLVTHKNIQDSELAELMQLLSSYPPAERDSETSPSLLNE
jgi:hypothetical protein